MVGIHHPAEPFAPKHRSGRLPYYQFGSDENILQFLMIPLGVIVPDVVWVQKSAQAEVVMRQEL